MYEVGTRSQLPGSIVPLGIQQDPKRRGARQQADLDHWRLATAIEQTAESVLITDATGRIEYVNRAVERTTGYTRDELIGQDPRILASGRQSKAFYRAMWRVLLAGRTWAGELVNRRKDGSLYVEEAVISPIRDADGTIVSFVAVQRDVTREREAASREERRTRERRLIAEALSAMGPMNTPDETAGAICDQVVRLPEVSFAVLLVFDADGTALPAGIAAPDGRVLVRHRVPLPRSLELKSRAEEGPWIEAWAQPPTHPYYRMLAKLHVNALAYAPVRGGSDLVGLLIVGSPQDDAIAKLTERLPALLEFGAIAGALMGPGLTAQAVAAQARSRIRTVLSTRAYFPAFQPILDVSTSHVVGYEAFTRFTDGTPAAERIAEATAIGLGIELELACIAAAIEGATDLPDSAWLNLNVSPALVLEHDGLLSLIAGHTREIVLDITEHDAITDYPTFRSAIASLGGSVKVAIDDAGAGFASFRHILELRPALVKLDRSLIEGIDEDAVRQALVAGLGYFAESARCRLVAEGVETEDELATLKVLGVEFAQGRYLSAPSSLPPGAADDGSQPGSATSG